VQKSASPNGPIYLIDVWDPRSFVTSLPTEFQPPTNLNPTRLLQGPGGYTILDLNVEDLKNVERLFDIRARVRWVEVVDKHSVGFEEAPALAGAWNAATVGSEARHRLRSLLRASSP